MNAVRAVRAYSGKQKIVAIEGAYHGSSDSLHVTSGVPEDFIAKVKRVPFNNSELLEKTVKELKGELAGVFIEPILGRIGSLAPREGYLKAVREITEDNDVLLVFDEVVTGFRIAPGGAAERFNVKPDMAVFGKIIGGGFSGAAFGGTKEIMDLFAYPDSISLEVINPKIRHPGTYNDHKVSMIAGLTTLNELNKVGVYEHLENVGKRIRKGLKRFCSDLGIKAQITGIASIFHIHFTDNEIIDATSIMRVNPLLIRYYDMHMTNRGINLAKAHSSFCSTPLTENEVEQTLSAMEDTLTAMKPTILEVAPELIV
jgi:glutamate-1-semialdehyde 2,1-aminomutase